MSTQMKQNGNRNVFAAVNADVLDRLRLVNNINVVLDGNNPPTVKAGTKFCMAGTETFTSSNENPTLNNVYPADTFITYNLDQAIFENADRTFAWSTTGFPAIENSKTYYLYCSAGEDIDINSRGKGVYGVSEILPTFSDEKCGFYNDSGLVIAQFTTNGSGNVENLVQFKTNLYKDVGNFSFSGKIFPDAGELPAKGGAYSRALYSRLFSKLTQSKGTFAVTIGASAIISLNNHGLVTGDCFEATTTGATPTGLTININYFVIYIDGNTFYFATSYANAIDGTKVTTSGSQSGVHTLRYCPWGISTSVNFLVPDLQGIVPSGVGTSTGFTSNEIASLGFKYDDKFQGHKIHLDTASASTAAGTILVRTGDVSGADSAQTGSLITDGTNGTPRTGLVTKGKTVGVNCFINF